MLGGPYDPDHAVRVGQMALEIAEDEQTGILAGAGGLVHNADRLIQHKMKLGWHCDAPKEEVERLVIQSLATDPYFDFGSSWTDDMAAYNIKREIVNAVLKHDGKNSDDDSPVLVTLMDAERLINAESDLIIRSGQFYHDLPPIDPIHFASDPEATYRDPKSVLRDIMESIECLTPGTPFYVRLPKARALAAERRVFFDLFLQNLVNCRMLTGFHPYPPELLALREKFAVAAATK